MYSIFKITLDSQIPMPELSQVPEATDKKVFTFSLSDNDQSADSNTNITWFHDWFDPNGEINISVGRDKGIYWLRFPNMVDFEIHLDEQIITGYRYSGTPDSTIRHMLLDQVIPRVLGQLGSLVLHAGAVRLESGKVVAFIGDSGWGKSTLVSSFQQHGAELITDDCLMIESNECEIRVIPNYYGVRLFDDSISAIFGDQEVSGDVAHYTTKRRLVLLDDEKEKATQTREDKNLDAICLLSDPDEAGMLVQVEITEAGGADAMMRLVAQTFVLDVTDKELMARQFQNSGKLFDSKIPCYILAYPRKLARLTEIRECIESVLEGRVG